MERLFNVLINIVDGVYIAVKLVWAVVVMVILSPLFLLWLIAGKRKPMLYEYD